MINPNKRGGKREGAGRKPRETPREAVTVRLEPEDADKLRAICVARKLSKASWIAEKIRNEEPIRIPSIERGCEGKANLGRSYAKQADKLSEKHGKQYGVYSCPVGVVVSSFMVIRKRMNHQPTTKMGYIRHDAIIATSWEEKHLNAARAKAEEIGLTCSEIVASPVNSYKSFMIVPDGSKEGWGDSDHGIAMRAEWVAWMRGHHREEEPCMWVDWAHVNFGGDDDELSTLADHSGISSENAKSAGDPEAVANNQ